MEGDANAAPGINKQFASILSIYIYFFFQKTLVECLSSFLNRKQSRREFEFFFSCSFSFFETMLSSGLIASAEVVHEACKVLNKIPMNRNARIRSTDFDPDCVEKILGNLQTLVGRCVLIF